MAPLPPPLLLAAEAAQRPEWTAATGLFNWGALLVPAEDGDGGKYVLVCV